jgi:hypothetical protein
MSPDYPEELYDEVARRAGLQAIVASTRADVVA